MRRFSEEMTTEMQSSLLTSSNSSDAMMTEEKMTALAMKEVIHTWHGSVRPRVDDLIAIGNSTVQIASDIVYRTIPSYASMALVFATGWVVAIAMSICVSCWICRRSRRRVAKGRNEYEDESREQRSRRNVTRMMAINDSEEDHDVVESAVPIVEQQQMQQMQHQPSAPPPRYLFDPSGTRRQNHVASLYPRAV
jgi:hypothetical protein